MRACARVCVFVCVCVTWLCFRSLQLMQKAQYEHMMRRLRKNQVSFDAHIKAMDNALKASKKEYSEVHTLMRQLENSKQEALQGLHKYQAQLAAARKQRAKELAERRQEASNARRMEEWRKQREAKRAELAAEVRWRSCYGVARARALALSLSLSLALTARSCF